MNSIKSQIITFTLCLLACAALAQDAQAAADRTFVSNAGTNANTSVNCNRAKPCRTIASALTVTSPGGIVNVLDSSSYGAFTVTQSVQVIAAPGALATIDPPSGDAITINAPGAVVTLRNLYLGSIGIEIGQKGINVNDVGALHVENCVINGFKSNGIEFGPTASNSELYVKDTTVGNLSVAINITPDVSTTGTKVSIEHCRLEHSFIGLLMFEGSSQVTIRDSVIAGNSSAGISANAFTARKFDLLVENCTLTGNNTGIRIEGSPTTRLTLTNSTISGSNIGLEVAANATNSKTRVAHTTFTHNATAIKRNGRLVTSFGNNRQVDNGASDPFSSTLPEI